MPVIAADTYTFSGVINRNLLTACTSEGHFSDVIDALESLADSISTYIASRTSHRGGKRILEEVAISEVSFGGVTIGNFFTQELDIDQMAAFLQAFGARRESLEARCAGYISTLLSSPLYLLKDQSVPANSSAHFILANIRNFQAWVLDSFNLEGISGFCSVLNAFDEEDIDRLAVMIGNTYRGEPERIYDVVRFVRGAASLQGFRDAFRVLDTRLLELIIERNEGGFLFRGTVEARALVERDDYELLIRCSDMVGARFEDQYEGIIAALRRTRKLQVEAGDSLYLARLGIAEVRFEPMKEKDQIAAEVELESGHIIRVGITPASLHDSTLLEAMAVSYKMSLKRAYELSIYLESMLLDLHSLDTKAGKKSPLRELCKRVFSRKSKTPIGALEVPRALLENAGFVNPLVVRGVNVSDSIYLDRRSFEGEMNILGRGFNPRNMQNIDVIDHETGGISKEDALIAMCYPILYLFKGGILPLNPNGFRQAMYYDFLSDQEISKIEGGEWISRSWFNHLLITDDAQASKLFDIITRISSVAALETAVLYHL